MSIFFIFLIGLFFGSFLNVLADRLPNDKSILGRSHCEFCNHTLGIKDLIPLISFVSLRGKCRYCKKKLPYDYPLSEFLTGSLFALTYILVNLKIFLTLVTPGTLLMGNVFALLTSIPFTPFMIGQYIFALSITSVLVVIFLADLRYGIIPDKILIFGMVATFIWLFALNQQAILNHLVASFLVFGFLFLIYVLTKGKGIGFGDVKLGFLMGLLLGVSDGLLALYLAFLTGGVIAIILVLWKKKRMKSEVAFGPFLVLGTYISFFLSVLIMPEIMAFLS